MPETAKTHTAAGRVAAQGPRTAASTSTETRARRTREKGGKRSRRTPTPTSERRQGLSIVRGRKRKRIIKKVKEEEQEVNGAVFVAKLAKLAKQAAVRCGGSAALAPEGGVAAAAAPEGGVAAAEAQGKLPAPVGAAQGEEEANAKDAARAGGTIGAGAEICIRASADTSL